MSDRFFNRPILDSPYEYPSRHWELDGSDLPTSRILDSRRRVSFITPIPKPKKRGQRALVFDEAAQALETEGQQYELMELISELRRGVDAWRAIPDSGRKPRGCGGGVREARRGGGRRERCGVKPVNAGLTGSG